MSPSQAGPRLSTLDLLSALGILPVNIFLPSLPNMAAEFGVDYGVIGLSLAAYAAVSAGLQIVMGLLDRLRTYSVHFPPTNAKRVQCRNILSRF